jgi:hypothetical protein
MVDVCPCTLGLKALLAWLALPLLVWVAPFKREGDPAGYDRALVSTLLIATTMFVLRWLRDATEGAPTGGLQTVDYPIAFAPG